MLSLEAILIVIQSKYSLIAILIVNQRLVFLEFTFILITCKDKKTHIKLY